ncbi:LacI family DNA-binding transcriptional regulator [Lactiplantibacillus daowaiensis]|uniref:LacI family DNA-binding transcriptional regulator n=1 Tax=Lactiplantibacillus daowaiensis TaxID=2559918 RepID=A0ABW1S4D7_9LACO|nr:LacI family DNA-binding transcriptional regulator [Lactiplantibacillus daowaiensis]
MVKLTDVAKVAGVSPTTVSRVINNYGSLSETTKQKVFAAMQQLNYQPNSLARSLQGKQTKLIGLIFPSVANPFFGAMVSLLETQLFAKGYRVMLCNAGDDPDKERACLRMLMANQVDGIIAGAHNLGIQEYEQTGLPIISFDRYLSKTIPIVSSDNAQGGRQAGQLMVHAGVKRPHIITSWQQPNSPTNQRLAGYYAALKAAGLTASRSILNFQLSPTLKLVQIKQLLTRAERPDGIFCTDDLTALLVLQVAQQLQLQVPTDLSVIGYDGTPFMQAYHPELTTISQPIDDLVTLMIDLLLQRIKNTDCHLEAQYTLPVKVIAGTTV